MSFTSSLVVVVVWIDDGKKTLTPAFALVLAEEKETPLLLTPRRAKPPPLRPLMKLFFAVILFIPAFVLVIIVKVIFSLQLWLLLLLFFFFFCCAFEENDDEFFSKVPLLLNPNRESKSKRSFGLSLKRRVHKKTFFLRHFFSEKTRLKERKRSKKSNWNTALSFFLFNVVNDPWTTRKRRKTTRANKRERVRVRESACETKRGGKREERRENWRTR